MFSFDRLYCVLMERGCPQPDSHIYEMLALNRHVWCKATPLYLRPNLASIYAIYAK